MSRRTAGARAFVTRYVVLTVSITSTRTARAWVDQKVNVVSVKLNGVQRKYITCGRGTKDSAKYSLFRVHVLLIHEMRRLGGDCIGCWMLRLS